MEKIDVNTLVLEISQHMREQGVPIGISEIIDAIMITKNYIILRNENISEDELREILRSVFVKRDEFNEVFEQAWRKTIADRYSNKIIEEMQKQVERSLNYIGLRYNQRFRNLENILSNIHRKRRQRAKEIIALLSQLGFIRRSRKGYYVVNKNEAKNIVNNMVREGYRNLREAYNNIVVNDLQKANSNYIRKNPLRYMYIDLDEKNLEKIETSKLLELGIQAYKNQQFSIAKRIANTLMRRADLLEKIDKRGLAYIKDMTPYPNNLLYQIVLSNPRLAEILLREKQYSRELLRKIAYNLGAMDPEKAEKILSIAIKQKGYELKDEITSMLENIPLQYLPFIPRSFARSLKGSIGRELEYTLYLKEAYRSLLKAVELGSEAYLEYAESLISKADSLKKKYGIRDKRYLRRHEKTLHNLYNIVKNLIEQTSDMSTLEDVLKSTSFDASWHILSSIYNNIENKEIKRRILGIALRLWYRETRLTRTKIVRGKDRGKFPRGTMNVRLTISNIIRFQSNPLVYNIPKRIKITQLAVDISGSMRKYSLWALLTASAFSKYIYRIILFSDKTYVIEKKHTSKLIDILLGSEFKGLTNITQALRTATKDSKVKRLIILSDLKQTIRDEDPVEFILRLYRRGWRIAVIMPPDNNNKAYIKLVENSIPTFIITKPEKAVRTLYKAWRLLH